MSKDISIKEGNQAKPFNNVRKIRINNTGGGSSYWVPEDETKLGTKHITKNGTYKASSDDLYGYSQVSVSGIGSTDFTAQAGDQIGGVPLEEDEDYTHDEDGVKLAPKYIQFDRQPYQVVYEDGDDINLTGAIVRAYSKKGKIIEDSAHPDGVIPYAELELVPDKADGSKVKEETYTDGEGVVANKFEYNIAGGEYTSGRPWYYARINDEWGICSETTTPNVSPVYLTRYNGVIYALGERVPTKCTGSKIGQDGLYRRTYVTNEMSGNGVFKAMPVLSSNMHNRTNIPESTADPDGKSLDELHIEGGVQEITVKWKLKEELTTILPIEVRIEEEDEDEEEEDNGGGTEF